MMNHTYLQEDVMIRKAVETLLQALGPVETARFLALPRQHRLDSVVRHHRWQESLDKKLFFDQVFGASDVRNQSSLDQFLALRGALRDDEAFDAAMEFLEKAWQQWTTLESV